MLKRLYPKEYHPSVLNINYDKLYSQGIKNIIFDIDNTLVTFNVLTPTEEISNLFAALKKCGFSICILSNNNEKRVGDFSTPLDVKFIHKAGKPGTKGALKALKLLSADPKNTAIIGDQIFTDTWCGNQLGLYTILVEPVSRTQDELITKVKRGVEAFVVRQYLKGLAKIKM
ncbi:MAG: YqeG family HAD IIIA-type phosphatase [Defluviitaleaceae bacterium]|nr:YqeG family HAD IIIA-type phosphatase [Defluviitaleaceae bacterium]